MAVLTVQHTTGATGLVPTFGAAAGGGDSFVNTSGAILKVKNGGGGSINVTITCQAACNLGGTTVHNLVVAVAPSATPTEIGPFGFNYNDANGSVQITYSGVTSVTVAVTAP